MEPAVAKPTNNTVWKCRTSPGLTEVTTTITRIGPTEYIWLRSEQRLNELTTVAKHSGYDGDAMHTTLDFTSTGETNKLVCDDFILARGMERASRVADTEVVEPKVYGAEIDAPLY